MPHIPFWLPPVIFLLTVGLIKLLAWPAEQLGWVDHPCTRKHHPHPIPLVGGVAMWAAIVIGVLLLPDKPQDYPILLACMTLLILVGLYDDLRHTRPALRFLFQAAAVVLMGLAEQAKLFHLGDLLGVGHITTAGWCTLFTVFAVVGMINAFNMIDGLDGLAGGLALIAVGWLLLLCLNAPVVMDSRAGMLMVLAMALAGFLVFNLRHPWRTRAAVFMGDAGSTMLGFALAWFMIRMTQHPQGGMDPITAVWIVALPLLDTVTVMMRRISAGCSPFAADRQHLHHLLLGHGLSEGRTVACMLALSLTLGGLGVLAQQSGIPEHQRFYAFLALFLAYYAATARMRQRQPPPRSMPDHDRRQPQSA